MTESELEISPVFIRWQIRCKECNIVFYVDTESDSLGEEIVELEDIHCGFHPPESSIIELV
jgi:hypothetical protein